MANLIDSIEENELFDKELFESHILYKFEKEKPFDVVRINEDTFEIKGERIEKLFKMTKFDNSEAVIRFAKKLRSYGVDEKLLSAGAKYGDTVKIFNYIFEFKE